jgi:hypothetical protein
VKVHVGLRVPVHVVIRVTVVVHVAREVAVSAHVLTREKAPVVTKVVVIALVARRAALQVHARKTLGPEARVEITVGVVVDQPAEAVPPVHARAAARGGVAPKEGTRTADVDQTAEKKVVEAVRAADLILVAGHRDARANHRGLLTEESARGLDVRRHVID